MMKVIRWFMVIPGALLAGMLGSLAGGIAFTIFGSQSLRDAGSAFFGSFALAFVAGLIAPSKRSKTTLIFSCVIVFLALLSFVLSVATNIEGFADRSALDKILIPVAQILGALYAVFLLPPIVIPSATLEDLWREIRALGIVVASIGVLISLVGLLVGLLGRTWAGLTTGLSIVAVGTITHLFPFVHLFLRFRRFETELNQVASTNVVGKGIKWTDIVRQVFRVLEFDRAGTTVLADGTVKAATPDKPYGYLLVESPILNVKARLPITHRDDFTLATTVYDEPKWVEVLAQTELLVTYYPKHKLPMGLAGITHALHYVIVPRGTLERYYEFNNGEYMANPAPEKLFKRFAWEGEIRVEVNPEPEF